MWANEDITGYDSREGRAVERKLLTCGYCSLGAFVKSVEIAENIFPRWWSLPGDQETIRAPEVSWSFSDKNWRSEDPQMCLIFAIIHLPNSRTAQGQSLKFPARISRSFAVLKRQRLDLGEKVPVNIPETQLEILEV